MGGAALHPPGRAAPFEHFPEKRSPVFRPEMRENKELECFRDSKKSEKTLKNRTSVLHPLFHEASE
ncbi:hypothetical protein GGD52_000290 [Agrobacterium tumefaciens]|nr:hypothetical protein [Agrobacterium radiobacter]MBB5585733.1 hypothetical protein [Agrobacterium radiobacter]